MQSKGAWTFVTLLRIARVVFPAVELNFFWGFKSVYQGAGNIGCLIFFLEGIKTVVS